MHKNYLVLRDNRESGPFTLAKLMQHQLRPTDMIWIEGESASWTFVEDLELTPPLTPIIPKHEEPAQDLEGKAEMLRQRALEHQHQHLDPEAVKELHIRDKDEIGSGEKFQLLVKKRRKPSMLGEVLVTLLILGIFTSGFLGTMKFDFLKQLFPANSSNEVVVKAPVEKTLNTAILPQSASAQITIATDSSAFAAKSDSLSNTVAEIKPAIKKVKPVVKRDTTVQTPVALPESTPAVAETPASDQKPEVEAATVQSAQEEAPVEKKKGFLRGLFKKHKKDKDSTDNN